MTSRILSPAKINLFLRVFERQADGYHRVETLMVKLAFGDVIDITLHEIQPGVHVICPEYPALQGDQNLMVRAARAFEQLIGSTIGVSFRLHKSIFLGAGLGGGSSNAGAVLRWLQSIYPDVDSGALQQVARSLGADVPFFLEQPPLALALGRGDHCHYWPSLPARPVVLIYPNIFVSTANIYQALGRSLTWSQRSGIGQSMPSGPILWPDIEAMVALGNDLQGVAEATHPSIGLVRQALLGAGARIAQMSGSGSTVFGLFDDVSQATQCGRDLSHLGRVVVTSTLDV